MKNRNYIFKVWGSTIVVAPMLTILASFIIKGATAGAFAFIIFGIAYGVLLSLPTLTLVLFLFNALRRKIENANKLKIILLMIGVVGIVVTFYLLYGGVGLNRNHESLTFSFVYSICLIVFGFIYPIRNQKVR